MPILFKTPATVPTPVASTIKSSVEADNLINTLASAPSETAVAEKQKGTATAASIAAAVEVDKKANDLKKQKLQTLAGELRVRTLDEFIVSLRLNDEAKELILAAINKENGSVVKDVTKDNVVQTIKNMEHAAKYFPLEDLPAPKEPVAYIASMNPYEGLHLGLLNPAFAEIVKEVRKRNNRLAVARPATGLGFPGFFGAPGLSISFPGMTGGALDALNMNFPIEMRGGGYDIAMQRGGNGLGLIGYRPITDSSFISLPLRQAFNQLRATLKAQDKDLDSTVEGKVQDLLKRLKDVEEEIKVKREELNTVTAAVVAGKVSNPAGITDTRLTQIAKEYSEANMLRSGIENKLLNVVIALGKQVRTVSF